MAQRQFRSDDTSPWIDRFGSGSNGPLTISANTTDATANTTATGTSAGSSVTAGSGTGFASGNLVIIHQSQGTGAGIWELNKISSTGAGTNWTMAYPLINTYSAGAQVYLLNQYTTATINNLDTLTSLAWSRGSGKGGILVIFANTSITLTGNISANNNGYAGGAPIGPVASPASGNRGEGINGQSGNLQANDGNAGGAGQTNNGGGGGGGNAATAGNGATGLSGTGGAGGIAEGSADLTTAVFGGGGGGGATPGDSNSKGGSGGTGGGFVFLCSPIITITGGITSNCTTSGAENQVSNGGDGGQGGGGSILIKGKIVTLGTGLVTATPGTPRGGTNNGGSGGTGSNGRIHVDYSISLSGTTTPALDSRVDTSLNEQGGLVLSDI